jgi:2-polyprenyl-6-methoxyphenol hydroxylase-like FAD-dependent oxidoreductase
MGLDGRHVVVIGAGIGGAAAALLCARAGARVTLCEREAEPRALGAGILLHPNGLAVLDGLDLDERLRRRGTLLSSLRVARADGRTLFEVPIPGFARGLDAALVVRRGELLAALLDLVAADATIACRFACDVVEVTPAGAVTTRELGRTETLQADLVVGADGVHSRTRKAAGIPARVGHGLRYVRGLGPDLGIAQMTEYWTPLGIFGVAPVDHGCYFYASTDAPTLRAALEERDAALFRDTWAAALPVARDALAGVGRFADLILNYVFRVDCTSWTAGRVVLLGDAAHAMAPNLGQGAGSALVDAVVLVRELAQPGETEAALARYEARRRPAVRVVQDIAGWLGWLSDVENPVGRALRDGALRLLGGALVGEVGMRLVEQQDPLWLRLAAANPTERLTPDVDLAPERVP